MNRSTVTPLDALRRCVEAMKLIDFADCKDETVWQALASAQGTAEGVLRDVPVAAQSVGAALSMNELMKKIDALPGYLNKNDCDWEDAYKELCTYVSSASTVAVSAAPSGDVEPNMLWDAEDPENGAHGDSAKDFAENYASGNMAAGDVSEISVLCATRSHSRKMRIEVTADEENWLKWEWIDSITATKE